MSMSSRALGSLMLLVIGGALLATSAQAQGITGLQGGDEPLEINADDGIEWRRDDQVYIARGNAMARRGDLAVRAQELKAYYRSGSGGTTEIYLIEAIDDVRMTSPNETIYAQTGVYNVIDGVLVLRGDNLKLETPEDVITARDSLEYWEQRQIAVARGDAYAKHGDVEVRADTLTAYLQADDAGKQTISTVRADGNVEIASPDEYASGDSGIYYAEQELATLTGKVKLTRDENQLNGQYAEVNLKTGVSRLLAAPPGGSDGSSKVRGLLDPSSEAVTTDEDS